AERDRASSDARAAGCASRDHAEHDLTDGGPDAAGAAAPDAAASERTDDAPHPVVVEPDAPQRPADSSGRTVRRMPRGAPEQGGERAVGVPRDADELELAAEQRADGTVRAAAAFDRSRPIPREPPRLVGILLALVAAGCLVAACFSHRWLAN